MSTTTSDPNTEAERQATAADVSTTNDSRSAARFSAHDLAASGALDTLFGQIDAGRVQLSGAGGLLPELIKAVLERGLQAERTGHLGYEKVKGEVTRYPGREPRDNPYYVITNIPADPQVVYHRIYAQRGDVENRLKELHHGIAFDRLSRKRFLANQARLLLHAAAYVLYQELRHAAAGTTLARAQVNTLRERLIKLGGWFERTRRQLLLHLPQDAPWRHAWARIATRSQATV